MKTTLKLTIDWEDETRSYSASVDWSDITASDFVSDLVIGIMRAARYSEHSIREGLFGAGQELEPPSRYSRYDVEDVPECISTMTT